MPTTVTKTIGSAGGRDYSTIASWEAAAPADLTTADQIWKGECYNDSEFVVTSTTTLSGSTSDSTRYKWLTAASGQSFIDDAGAATNPLKYDQTKGVGIKTTTSYVNVLALSENYALIERLQIYANASGATQGAILCTKTATINRCICESGPAGNRTVVSNSGTGVQLVVKNSVVISRYNNTLAHGVLFNYPASGSGAFNCTIVKPSDDGANATGVITQGSGSTNATVKNCAIFGWGTVSSGSFNAGSGYNATNGASAPGSNNQTSLTYSSQFQGTTDSTRDYRALSTGSLQNGTPDTTNTGGVDIVGQTRDATTPYIGAWEVVSGSTTNSGSLSISSSATLTGTGGATSSASHSIQSAAVLYLNGGSIAQAGWSSSSTGLVSWESSAAGTINSGDLSIASAAALTFSSNLLQSGDWSISASGIATFSGQSTSQANFSIVGSATVSWTGFDGSAYNAGDWSSASTSSVTFTSAGVGATALTIQSSGVFSPYAQAFVSAYFLDQSTSTVSWHGINAGAVTIITADLSIAASSSLSFKGSSVSSQNLDGWRRQKIKRMDLLSQEDEEIMFIIKQALPQLLGEM